MEKGARSRVFLSICEVAMTERSIWDKLNTYGASIADSVYQASVVSVFAYAGVLLLLGSVGAAVWAGAVDVPEFHPR
jgi:hypothetical protein